MPKVQKLPAGRGIRNKKPWTIKEVQEPIAVAIDESPLMPSSVPEDGEELRESANFFKLFYRAASRIS